MYEETRLDCETWTAVWSRGRLVSKFQRIMAGWQHQVQLSDKENYRNGYWVAWHCALPDFLQPTNCSYCRLDELVVTYSYDIQKIHDILLYILFTRDSFIQRFSFVVKRQKTEMTSTVFCGQRISDVLLPLCVARIVKIRRCHRLFSLVW